MLEKEADILRIYGNFTIPKDDRDAEPRWNDVLMNGTRPESVSPYYIGTSAYAYVSWVVPISGNPGSNITLTPSTTNQYAWGEILSLAVARSKCVDKDGDGHNMKSLECPFGDDCNDSDPAVFQGCSCNIGDTQSCSSSPTAGIGVCKAGTQSCTGNAWGDCGGEVLPSPEICDGLDNDCNGQVDDNITPLSCYTGPNGTAGVGLCKAGIQTCTGGKWGACTDEVLPVAEVDGNGLDDNCNGIKDEGFQCKDERPTHSTVNMATGNLSHSQALYSAKKAVLPFDLNLTYNSVEGDGPLGRGWTHSYNISIRPVSNGGYEYVDSDGRRTGLSPNGSQFTPLNSDYPALTVDANGTYTLGWSDGRIYSFSQSGKITGIRDRYSNSIAFSYADGKLTEISDSQGRSASFTYNTDNRIETITDPNGNIHTFTYGDGPSFTYGDVPSEIGSLLEVSTYTTDSQILTWKYTYRNGGGMQTKTNPMNRMIQYYYRDSRLDSVIDDENRIQTLTFDPATTQSTFSKGADLGWVYAYAPATGKLATKSDPEGYTTSYQYETNKEVVTDAKGNITEYEYGTGKNLLSFTEKSPADPVGRTTRYTYNQDNEILTITDPEEHTTTYTYDMVDGEKIVSVEDPAHEITETRYYADGRIKYIKNPKNQTTSFTYVFDPVSRTTTETSTDFLGASTVRVYDLSGNMIESRDVFDTPTKYEYNSINQLKTVKDYLDRVVSTYEYWPDGTLMTATDANGNTTYYEYNYDGKITKIVDPLGNTTTYSYGTGIECPTCSGNADNLVSVTDANNKTTTYEYYKNGWKKNEKDPLTHVVSYGYDGSGFMTSLTDPAQAVTQFDKADLVTTKTDPLGKATTYEYDKAGRLTTRTDRKNDVIRYTYTPDGVLESITYPDNSTVVFENDELDRTTRMTDNLGQTTYVYDDDNRTVTVTDPHGFVVIYKNDEAGRLKELTYPGNKKVVYGYDKLNRMETVRLDWLNQTATYEYDPAGRLKKLTNFNGTVTTYGYDDANRLTSLENKKSDNSIISSYSFPVLDGVGNRAQAVVNEPFTPVLNPEDTGYTYNEKKNRLEVAGATTFGYDFEGQLARINTDTYTFDYEHRLKGIQQTGFSGQYSYDGKGNRLEAVRNGVKTYYIYDMNGNVLAEADGGRNITRYYIQGQGLLAMVTPTDQVYPYHFNAIGSTVVMTGSSEDIVNEYAYDSFGAVLSQDESIVQPFKYVGQYGVMAEPNGFYYMRARYYDPNVGRFVSEDPIGFEGGTVNLHEYVGNNPVNAIDPTGLIKIYGNWCGPNWTGGYDTEYTWLPPGSYKDPIDNLDSACKTHDICYYNCRNDYPCDEPKRSQCFRQCDYALTNSAYAIGSFWGDQIAFWIDRPGDRDPGQNDKDCSCKIRRN